MNYEELTSKFWDINEKTPMSASTIALYLFLLEECKKNDGEDFSISDNMISKKLSITRPTINVIKSRLRNMGLIQYKIKNGIPCIYRILSNFTFIQEVTKEHKITERIVKEKPKQEHQQVVEQEIEIIAEKEVSVIKNTIPSEPVKENIIIPSFEEFINFAKTL